MENYLIKIISYLNLLELPLHKEISYEVVTDAYRKLVHIYHPDVANNRYKDGKKFIELQEAKEYLIKNIDIINDLIKSNYSILSSSKRSDAHEESKQDDFLRKKKQEEEEIRRQKEEAEKKAAEEAAREKKRQEERRKQQEQLRKELYKRKERALSDVKNLNDSLKKEEYLEEDYDIIIQYIMLFFVFINEEKYLSINDIDEKYNDLINKIQNIKTKSQMEKIKRNKKITFISITSISIICILFFICVNIIIPNFRYNKAIYYYNHGQYQEAENIFMKLNDYKASVKYLEKIQNSYNFETIINDFMLDDNKNYKEIISKANNFGVDIEFEYILKDESLVDLYENGYYESAHKDGYEFENWTIIN